MSKWEKVGDEWRRQATPHVRLEVWFSMFHNWKIDLRIRRLPPVRIMKLYASAASARRAADRVVAAMQESD